MTVIKIPTPTIMPNIEIFDIIEINPVFFADVRKRYAVRNCMIHYTI